MMRTLDCDVVVLCGGFGSRLRSVIADRPKPMAMINGRPFLSILVDRLVEQGCRRIVFGAGHKSAWITDYFAHDSRFQAVYSVESQPLGTGGAVALCRPQLHSADVVVCNGDTYCEVDIAHVLDEHRRSGCAATIVLVPSDERQDGGAVSLGADHRVRSFAEKRSAGAYLNAGLYVFRLDVLYRMTPDMPLSLEHDVFPALVPQGVHGVIVHTPLYDIGTPERLDLFRTRDVRHTRDYAHTLQGGQE